MDMLPSGEQLRTADTLYIIDLDRCLLQTGFAQDLLELAALEVADVNPSDMKQARKKTENSGGSFNTLGFLRQSVQMPEQMHDIKTKFLEYATASDMGYVLREEGAAQLLELLDSSASPYMIMTYGSSEWQTLKLEAAGWHMLPYIVTDDKRKGYRIREAYDEQQQEYAFDGVHNAGVVAAGSVCLIDDKAISFAGLRDDPRTWGLQVLSGREPQLLSQKGELPPQVVPVVGLTAVRSTLATIIDKT